MMKTEKTIILFIINLFTYTHGYRILGLFVHPGKSHVDTFIDVLHGLTKKGHDVTFFSYFSYPINNPNYTEINIENVPKDFFSLKLSLDTLPSPSRSLYSQIEEIFELNDWAEPICSFALGSPSIDKLLRIHQENPFDLVLLEYFNSDCMLGLVHQMKIPSISLSSCAIFPWHYDIFGLPDTPSYIPSSLSGFSKEMSFPERVNNWLSFKLAKVLYRLRQQVDNEVIKNKFGPGIPDVAELRKNASLMFVSQHYSLSGVKPLTVNVIEVGGIHIKTKALPENLKIIMDNAKHGVIVVSWGSAIMGSSIDPQKVQEILRVFGRLKQQVIWKWEADNIPNKSSNVYTQKWLPQSDVLCHPNVKLFWSHGGNLGSLEAANCGVPIIVTPIYGDQFLNGNAFTDRKMGLILPYKSISEQSLTEAITTVLQPSYSENAKKVSYTFRNRPMSPVDTATWWVEHTIETGGNHLAQSYANEISWFVYHSLDVVLLLISVILLILSVFFIVIYCCCCRRKSSVVNKVKKH